MEEILNELREIKKELQDIRGILEPEEMKIKIDENSIIEILNTEMKKTGKTLIFV